MAQNKSVKSIEYRIKWLEKEFDILERKIEFYDDLSFKIKGWTVVSWFALISYAITNNGKLLLLLPGSFSIYGS